MTVHGRTGPVNAVEVDGTLFIQNDEAEAKAEATLSKAMGPASAVAVASEAAATTAAASEVAEQAVASKAVATTAAASEVAEQAPVPELAVATAALDPEPCCAAASPAVIKSNSYAAAVSKPSVRPKLSAAASPLSVNLKRSTSASKPAAAVLTSLEVSMHMHMQLTCTCTCAWYACLSSLFAPDQEFDDFLVAHRIPPCCMQLANC